MKLDEDSKYFSIQMAAQLSGLSAHTIRAWEKRYQAISPSRSDNGRRLYSTEEVERLNLLSQLTNLGSSISQIASLPDEELKTIHSKLISTKSGALSLSATKTNQILSAEETKNKLIEALEKYQVDTISVILSEAKLNFSPKELALKVLDPVLKVVRELSRNQTFKHAQVQALEALIKFHAGTIVYSHYEKAFKNANKIVLTTMENNHQTLDILLGALLCCEYNHSFYYLSANLPSASIVEAMNATESNVLILGIAPTTPDQELRNHLELILGSLPAKTQILVIGDREKVIFPWKNCSFVRSPAELDKFLTEI